MLVLFLILIWTLTILPPLVTQYRFPSGDLAGYLGTSVRQSLHCMKLISEKFCIIGYKLSDIREDKK